MFVSTGGRRDVPMQEDLRRLWRVGEIEIDPARAEVSRGGRTLPLDRSGYALLLHLVEHAGEVVGKDDLLKAGWPGRVVSENSLAKAIGRLRVALDDTDAELIRVVHGYGYRLAAAAAQVECGAAAEKQRAVDATARARWPAGRAALVLAAAGILLIVFVVLQNRGQPRAATAMRGTVAASEDIIAVLPLHDLSPARSLGVLADGFADHLRDQFQRMPALRIVNRSDSLALRDDPREAQAKARELGSDLLVDGDVSLDSDRLRVVLRLHDSRGRIAPWSHTFDRPPQDQATLLEDMTAALFGAIGGLPGRWGHDPQRGRGTANEQAYQTFLRAATLFGGNNDPNSQRRALAVLEQAIELDPNYADAWIMLGGILGGSGYYADSKAELLAGRKRALAAISRGISLAPSDSNNYLARSEMRLLYAFDWAGAEADLEAASAHTPGGESAQLLIWKARLLASQGRIDEAIALDARAIALDPQSGARRNQGWHYMAKGDTRNARAVLLLQLEDLPENPHTNFYLALCDIFEGQPEPALRRLEHSSTLFRLVGTAIARHELGDRTASDLALDKLVDQFAIADGYWVGAVHAWRGENDEAFQWLDRALRGGDSSIMYLTFDPLLVPLRDDPRYRALLTEIGLPP